MGRIYVGSALCAALATAVDSLVAGAFIGTEALAAVAAAAPFLAVDGILHCLLGFGIDKLMIQAVGRGEREKADRIFATILLAVFVSYCIVVIPGICFGRRIIAANLANPEMVEPVYQYCWPRFLAMPLLEVCLCIERAFRVDGRAKLFASRALVMSVLNIILDFILVFVMDNQVQALAWATVIAALLGYTIPLSHFFSKTRTVRPDFTVIRCLREMWDYIKADIRLGSSATWDEVLEMLLVYAQTAAVGAVGGTAGLAVWSVYKSFRSIAVSLSNGVSSSVSVHAGLLYGENDYDGVRYAAKQGSKLAQLYCIAVAVIVFALAGPIADLYKIAPESRQLCMQCLRIGCLAYPAIAVMTVFSLYLPSVDRSGLSSSLLIVQKGLPYLAAVFSRAAGLQGFITEYVLAIYAALMVLEITFRRDGSWFVPKENPETIDAYSIRLSPETISAVSSDIRGGLKAHAYPERLSTRAALVMEEALCYIMRQNPDAAVLADVKADRHEDDIQFTIIDEGTAYNPFTGFEEAGDEPFGELENILLMGLTVSQKYDRMLDLNHLVLFVATE